MPSSLDDSSSSDMASEDESQVDYPPHGHRKRFSITEFSRRNVIRKIMAFRTRCAMYPSAWEVEIILSKSAQFANFIMSVALRRIDLGQIPLEGYALVYLSNFDDKVCPVPYPANCEVPYYDIGDVDAHREVSETFQVDDHYKCLFMDGHDKFRYDMLLVKTQLLVLGCCGPSEPEQENSLRSRND